MRPPSPETLQMLFPLLEAPSHPFSPESFYLTLRTQLKPPPWPPLPSTPSRSTLGSSQSTECLALPCTCQSCWVTSVWLFNSSPWPTPSPPPDCMFPEGKADFCLAHMVLSTQQALGQCLSPSWNSITSHFLFPGNFPICIYWWAL